MTVWCLSWRWRGEGLGGSDAVEGESERALHSAHEDPQLGRYAESLQSVSRVEAAGIGGGEPELRGGEAGEWREG